MTIMGTQDMKSTTGLKGRPIIVSGVWALSGLIMLAAVYGTVSSSDGQIHENPRMWPVIGSVMMFGSGLFVMRTDHKKRLSKSVRSDNLSSGDNDSENAILSKRSLWRPSVLMLSIATYVAVLPWLGYVLSTAVLSFVVCQVLGNRSLVKSLLVSIVVAISTTLLFSSVLGVALPQGISPLDGVFRILY